MVTKRPGTDAWAALDAFTKVAVAHEKQAEQQRYLVHTMVVQLRAAGMTWRDIGKAAGISHVAAMKRWKGDPVPPVRPVENYGDPEDQADDDDGGW